MCKNKFALALAGAAGLCLSSTAFGQVFSSSPALAIPDLGETADVIAVSGGPASIVGMRVTIDVTHTWDADLDIALAGPSGTNYLKLCDDVGGAGDNFSGTVFEDGFPSIATGAAPFTGTFSPEGGASNLLSVAGLTALASFAGFAGSDSNGNWTLNLGDQVNADTGTLNSWSVEFTGIAPPPPPPPAAHDMCADAEVVVDGAYAYDLTVMTNEGNSGAACGASAAAADQWYSYTPTDDGILVVSTCGLSGGDTVLAAYSDCATQILCLDDFCGLQTEIQVPATNGVPILIRVAGFGGGLHAGQVNFALLAGDPPVNDSCAGALAIGEGTVNWDNTFSTEEGPDECLAFGSAAINSDIWFLYTATAAADVLIFDTCGTTMDTKIAIYDATAGCPTVSSSIACNDDSCGLQSRARICGVAAGAQYYVRVGAFDPGTYGTGVLTITSVPNCDVVQPGGSAIEAEACGADSNGGCNLGNAYEALSCGGSVVFGSSWADANTRDTDWYSFSQYGAGDITATVNAEFPAVVFILDGLCPPTFFGTGFAADELNTCADITATATAAPAGDYAIFVSTGTNLGGVFAGYPCGGSGTCPAQNDYVLTVSNTGSCIPLGACCAPAGCSIMTEADCATAGGTYLGDASECATPSGYNFAAGSAAIEDISGTGTNLFLTDDSNAFATLGFTFNFYGVDFTDCFVGSNGMIGFGAGSNVFVNGAIPSAALPNNTLYVYWDDFNPGAGGEVLTETRGTAGTDLRFIAQWNNVPQFGGADANTFQCIIWENGTVEYRYATVPGLGGGDATVGVENADGTLATSVDESLAVSGTSLTGSFSDGSSNCPSCAWQADGCYSDYNNDGGIDGDDVISFFADWDTGLSCADVDGANGTDGDDVIAFFGAWDAGGVGFPGC